MTPHLAQTLILVRPAGFGYHFATAQTYQFQSEAGEETHKLALGEFDKVVEALSAAGLHLKVIDEPEENSCPDAIFPNNWFSSSGRGQGVLYPMLSAARQAEVRPALVQGFIREWWDMRPLARPGEALEGTGSLVIDWAEMRVFMLRSPRSSERLARLWAQRFDLDLFVLDVPAPTGEKIYHTNVVLSVSPRLVFVWDALMEGDLPRLMSRQDREMIALTWDQICAFAGNSLQAQTPDGKVVTLMSESAWSCLSCLQQHAVTGVSDLVVTPAIAEIERVGGGSLRCMIAEYWG